MRRLAFGAAMLGLVAGCAILHPASVLLDRADRLAEQGDYAGALEAYEELLARYPGDWLASRALAGRRTVTSLLAARSDIARLRQELTVRDMELTRLKHDLEKLREDLENLKKMDLRERRR